MLSGCMKLVLFWNWFDGIWVECQVSLALVKWNRLSVTATVPSSEFDLGSGVLEVHKEACKF